MTTTTLVTSQMDLVQLYESSPLASPVDEIRLSWGIEPGEVGRSAGWGPCCFDILPDGSIAVLDLGNLRVQLFRDGIWTVIRDFHGGPLVPDGIAALDSGHVAVVAYPIGDSEVDRTVLILDDLGEVVTSGLSDGHLNNAWWGGEDLWLARGNPPFTSFVRITADGLFIPYSEQQVTERYVTDALSFMWTYDRRGDNDSSFNLSTLTVGVPGSAESWVYFGGPLAGGTQLEPSDGMVVALWWAADDYLVVTAEPGASPHVLRIRRQQSELIGTFNGFRVHDRRLYLLQTYEDGARIEIYDLIDTR